MGNTSAQGLGCSVSPVGVGATVLGLGRKRTGGVLHEEVFEGLGAEVLEDSPLAFFPSVVQRAWSTFSASTVLHDAAGDAEGSFHGFHGLPERNLGRGLRQPGAPAAALFAFDQTRVG